MCYGESMHPSSILMKARGITPAATTGIALFFSAGCSSTDVADNTGLDGPVRGRADVTSFVAGTDGSDVSIGNLAKIAKTIRKYKNLGANEQEIIRRVASLKLDGLVAREMQILAPQFQKKKEVVRQRTEAKIQAVRQKAVATRLPAREVARDVTRDVKREPKRETNTVVTREVEREIEREVATVRAEEKVEIAKIDLEWDKAARSSVASNYGTDFAVPVQNAEGKAVVAFASVKESKISVSAAAYELAGTSRQLVAAASTGKEISHEGQSYKLISN